jgi:hypothetical protein
MTFDDLRLSDIRKVEVWFVGSSPTSYLVHVDEVAKFVEATKCLHFDPGVNPHQTDKRVAKCAKIWKIEVQKLAFKGPYWWTMPRLGVGDDCDGARILDGEIVGAEEGFIDRAYVDRLNAEEDEMEDEWERRNYR